MAKILITEDDLAGRKLLATLLAHAGHRVIQARDGAEALALMRREHPDLVIADVLMPVMDGYEFARQLRADTEISCTPVVFHTATFDEREARLLAERCGVMHVLTKPTDAEQLLRVVTTVLNEQRPYEGALLSAGFEHDHLRLVTNRLLGSTQELEALNVRLAGLIELGLRLASEADPTGLLNIACDGARELLGAESAVLELNNNHDAQADPFSESSADRTHRTAAANPLRVALSSPSQTYGWIVVQQKLGGGVFSPDDQHLLSLLAAQLALAYENAQRARSLADAIRARDEFLVTAAHELKTPLTTLLASAQILLRHTEQPLDSELSARRLTTIAEQTRRMSNLVSRLLDVSRIQLGRLALDPGLVDLSTLVSKAAATYASGGSVNRLLVNSNLPSFVKVDPLRIEQVLVNLLDNAFKFSPGGEPIEVKVESSRVEADHVLVSVRDHGIGIPADNRANIFDRFYQAHASDHRSGLGLGLFISREIVELHGGRMRAEFPPDGGTRFVVELPLASAAHEREEASQPRHIEAEFETPAARRAGGGY